MEEPIEHKGKITEINPETTTVEIVSQSACAACHAKQLCGLSDNVTKEVRLRTVPGFELGEEVRVTLSRTMGHKAVWLSYVIPVIVLLVLVLVFSSVFESELLAGACAIAGVALWYFVVWLFRKRLRNEFVFKIEKEQ